VAAPTTQTEADFMAVVLSAAGQQRQGAADAFDLDAIEEQLDVDYYEEFDSTWWNNKEDAAAAKAAVVPLRTVPSIPYGLS
jgi:hypothetical protein